MIWIWLIITHGFSVSGVDGERVDEGNVNFLKSLFWLPTECGRWSKSLWWPLRLPMIFPHQVHPCLASLPLGSLMHWALSQSFCTCSSLFKGNVCAYLSSLILSHTLDFILNVIFSKRLSQFLQFILAFLTFAPSGLDLLSTWHRL